MTASPRIEHVAEAVIFAHDPQVSPASDPAEHADLERIAAWTAAALATPAPVPADLQARLLADGVRFCHDRRSRGRQLRHFLLGAAAVATVWLGTAVLAGRPQASIAERRAAVLAAPESVKLAWSAGPSPLSGRVAGDVVWNNARQEGYLSLRGLPPLDPHRRFQLWIVDRSRTGSPPVDGGLFAIEDAAADSVLPIRPALPIGEAAAFVITVEDESGVVVSKQEHVVATAGI